MMGGLAVLGVATLIGDAVSRYGIEEVLVATYRERRYGKGELCEMLYQEIDTLWISDEMKWNIKRRIDCV